MAPFKRVFLGAAAAALAMSLGVAADPVTAAGENKPIIRVSTQSKDAIETWTASSVLDDAPYVVEWSLLPTATEETASLLAKTTDIAVTEGTVSVTLQQGSAKNSWADGKAPVTIIAAHTPRNSVDYKSMVVVVAADSDIKEPKDLKGRSITFKEGGNMNTQALLTVKAGGLTPTDVKLVNLNPADGLVAFRSGQIDALSNSPAQLQDLIASGRARVLTTNVDVDFPASTATVVRTADLKDPVRVEIYRDFVRRIQRWNNWKADNREAFKKILIELNHLKPAVAEYHSGFSVSDVNIVDEEFLAKEQVIADVLAESGGIPKKVDVRLQYDTRFNDDIAAERNKTN